MLFFRSELTDEIVIPVDEYVQLESLRQAVVPPYLMLMPFIIVPDGIVVEDQLALDEDGVHGCIYVLRAERALIGDIEIGFKDMQTQEITHSKQLRVIAL